jgi:hypothetical protein
VPEGFKNNVAWNFGHIIVSQQTLCYARAGVPLLIDQAYIDKYQKGTKPEGFIGEEEINILKTFLFSLIDTQQKDCEENKFSGYQGFTTQYGVTLNSINDAVPYVATHDALHFGFSKAIANAVRGKKFFPDFQHIKISN